MPDRENPSSQRGGGGWRNWVKNKSTRSSSRSKGADSAAPASSSRNATKQEQQVMPTAATDSQNKTGKTVQRGTTNEIPLPPDQEVTVVAARAPVSSSEEPIATTIEDLAPINRLWEEAYEELKATDEGLIARYEKALFGGVSAGIAMVSRVSIQRQMEELLKRKVAEANENRWKIRFYGKEIPVKDLAGPVLGTLKVADDYISKALATNPYASIAWAGVSLLLPLALNPSEQAKSLAENLDYVSDLITRSMMRENLYTRRHCKAKGAYLTDHASYRNTLKALYVQILKFQAGTICYLSKNDCLKLGKDLIKWDDWASMLSDIKTKETAFNDMYSIWKDTISEEASRALERRHNEIMNTSEAMANDLRAMAKAIATAQEDQNRRSLLQWLSPVTIDPSKNLNNAKNKRNDANTGEWLLRDSEDFQRWKVAPKSLLWLNGKAGSGKSVLSSSVIQHLKKSYHDGPNIHDDPNIALGYFFFSFAETSKQSTTEMICSIIKQICCQRPDTPLSVESLRKFQEMGQRPDRQTLENTLLATLRDFSHVYLILDALDECPIANIERRTLLNTIRRIYRDGPESLHLFVTSRRELDIGDVLTPIIQASSRTVSSFDINLSHLQEILDQDIGMYITQTLDVDFTSPVWSPDLKEKTKAALLEKADGMFQYVSCQFDELLRHEDENSIRKALKSLPDGLDDTYDRMLRNIEPKYKKNVANVLKWLVFSLRPLSLEEVAEAFIIDHDNEVPFDENNRIRPPARVLRYLSGFVTEVKIFLGKTEVRFAHFSIKEYLRSIRITQIDFSTPEPNSHLHISESCLAYHIQLSKSILATEDTVKKYPLWTYASSYGVDHLESAGQEFWLRTIPSRALAVFDAKSQSLLNLVRMRDLTYEFPLIHKRWYVSLDQLAPPLFYAAAWGAVPVVPHLLDAGADVNSISHNSRYETPVQAAAGNGHEAIVRLLVKKHANVNLQVNDINETALSFAVSGRRVNIAMILLDAGADVNAKVGYYGNALQEAAYGGDIECIKLLLNSGAKINTQGGHYGNALQAAALEDDIECIKLLLDSGAKINAQGGHYGNALQAAALRGDIECIKLLLNSGAKINAQGGHYGNALQAAALRDDIECIKLLLNSGAKINAQGGHYGNALQAAALRDDIERIKLLLNSGAKINAQGGNYGNALRAAIVSDNLQTAEFLLSQGAEFGTFSKEVEEELARNLSKEYEGNKNIERIRKFRENPDGYFEQRREELERERGGWALEEEEP